MIVFADSYALIAWLNRRDEAHVPVTSYLEKFTGRLVTTEWILMELADALSAPASRGTVAEFLRAVRLDPMFEVVEYQSEIYDAGFELFCNRSDKSWSLTDCISFSVMTEHKLVDALTADRHFEQAGFRAVFLAS
jgi:predicted nucleic acid-binding protein